MLFIILLYKTMLFCAAAIALRGTLPRYRFDQLLQLTWKNFIFIWLGFIILNIDLLFFFNILPFFDINHYFNAWILNYLNTENSDSKYRSTLNQSLNLTNLNLFESLKASNQSDAEFKVENSKIEALDSSTQLSASSLNKSTTDSNKSTAELTNDVVSVNILDTGVKFSIDDVKVVFAYVEKEVIEICVDAYTNKNLKLEPGYALKDASTEFLDLKKKEMIDWLLELKKNDEVYFFIKAMKICSFDITKQSYAKDTQTFEYILDPIEFLKFLTYSEHSSLLKQKMLEVLKNLRESAVELKSRESESLIENLRAESEFGERLRKIQERN